MAKAKTANAIQKPKPQPIAAPISQDQPQFEHKGKKYRVILHAVIIPGIGQVTAADIAADAQAQAYLIEAGTIGSVIEQVVD